jgi:hypothetical protein
MKLGRRPPILEPQISSPHQRPQLIPAPQKPKNLKNQKICIFGQKAQTI